ncbi:MAG: PIN domain-containing protein [Acidimicrobiia bacterium]|nr:MAG: PIN domain-containing protein [Acidimicrobiia bacterium]
MSGVLDASALLALINKEEGAGAVLSVLEAARMSTVNIAEVLAKLSDIGMPPAIAEDLIGRLGLTVEPFELIHAERAARFRPATRRLGLSLGDRACLALAQERGLPAYTADQSWSDLQDVTVHIIH